jgi:tetratricopeptide (TPR) repeat protein
MIYPIIKAQRRVDDEEAKALVVTVRQIAAKYPDDVAVQIALAEAEIDAKNPDAGLVAADRAIALDPKAIKAYLQKGRSLFRKAQDSHKPEDWQAARNLYLAANRMEMDNPIPLIEFYRTFIESGITPSKSSIIGIERAAVLAPFDRGLQWMVADQYARDGRYAEAISKLEPIAYSPHQGESAKNAQARIAEWQAKTKANLAKP